MKILLIGDFCRDIFIEGNADRLAPEFPVPVFVPTGRRDVPGMGGNVLENLKSLKPDLEVVSLFPETNAVKVRHIDRKTGHHFLRVDSGIGECESIDSRLIYFSICPNPTRCQALDAVVVSDYNKGFLRGDALCQIGQICETTITPWFLDTKRIIGPWAKGAILKINHQELENNLSAGVRPWEHVSACIITNGAQGMDLYGPTGEIVHHVEGPKVEVRDGAGCGDTVLAALVVAYLENGFDLKGSMAWADKAGRVAVSKRGVVAVKREEVL